MYFSSRSSYRGAEGGLIVHLIAPALRLRHPTLSAFGAGGGRPVNAGGSAA